MGSCLQKNVLIRDKEMEKKVNAEMIVKVPYNGYWIMFKGSSIAISS